LNQMQFAISGSGKNPSDMGIEKAPCCCISDVSQACIPGKLVNETTLTDREQDDL